MQCLFIEPWIGQCKENTVNGLCCEKHAKEKCQVCGDQAATRCQASRGLMCGVPLCSLCGAGEMCLHHAGSGPLFAIKALLGAGPEPTIFSTVESLKEQADEMERISSRLKEMNLKPTMEDFKTQMRQPHVAQTAPQ